MSRDSRISPAEWEVISVLWKKSPLSAPEVMARLPGSSWQPSTVRTFLSRLVKKKFLSRSGKGHSGKYSAALSREDCVEREAADFLHRIFDGDTASLISHYLTSQKFKKSALSDLQSRIKRIKKKK